MDGGFCFGSQHKDPVNILNLWFEESREGKRWSAGVHSRVQWFWHFFRNSICFMCFWFGLEIIRLVYKKKCCLKYWKVSILFYLLSFEKSSTAPYRGWKKNSSKLGVQGIKRSGILRWFKKCAEVLSLAKGKNFVTERLNFLGLGKFSKKLFFWEKIFGNFLEVKSSNKIETDQYFKKRFFIN